MDMNLPIGTYGVDIVFCIDATSPEIEENRIFEPGFAANFFSRWIEKADECYVDFERVRVKMIVLGPYNANSDTMLESSFFEVPEQNEELDMFLASINWEPGSDESKSASDALSLAMKSEWSKDCLKNRHIIVMMTDSTEYKLEKTEDRLGYLLNVPKDWGIDEIVDFVFGAC